MNQSEGTEQVYARPVGWNEKEDALLREHHAQGASMAEICKLLADAGMPIRSRNSVIGRCHRLGLAARRNTPVYRRQAVARVKPSSAKEPTPQAITTIKPSALINQRTAPVVHVLKPKAQPRVWDGNHVRFMDRAFDQCSFILDDRVTILDRMVCGAPVERGHSWCLACFKVVYEPRGSAKATAGSDNAQQARVA